ncbi:MAG: hypothetical protein V4622_01125 [Bacteroidota bacterium]
MKNLGVLLVFSCLISFWNERFYAQDSLKWEQISKLDFTKEIVWNIDVLENQYIAEKDQLIKYDSNGKLLFSQSLKKFGEISFIDVRNPMKIMLFSEQQQALVFLDNTLTKQENDIDLSDLSALGFEISYATQVSSSIQSDKIWVFDQENSTINLIATNKAQSFKIENSAGILNFSKVSQFFEANDNLYLLDAQKGIFIFDRYGTLISHQEESEISFLEVDENFMYILKHDKITILNLKSDSKKELKLPIKNVKKFKIREKSIFLEAENAIYKFSLEVF